ncbi:hypothetical protein PFICI_03398 [Pestalotiopsis fici W106-1]|uniref:Rhodopsin domain-containing protein n=1 Tax=Pestalotiopsis fici (strain W106-1 / CGMCC3.15140) TaxID=1229662 RepID=W3XH08_PESFW|nr:uncharacterized protein PFICI_03398 [Pestalotiopsis fici W106-1]ETS85373.1 hypothetical protein PFICI_03398 [Pestalotiopsis fici W106-1]
MYNPYTTEAWIEYAISLLIIIIRIGYRCSVVGWDWAGDDYIAAFAVPLWTGVLCMLQMISEYGSITGMTDAKALTLTDDEIKRIEIGSKCLLAGWCLYVTMIFCMKGCMLFVYQRLTFQLEQQRLVKIASVMTVLAYIATIMVCLTRCMPFHKNWQVYPYPGDACALNVPNYLALIVTNVTTDLVILYIPMPLLWAVKMPLRRKVLCGFWLSLGFFIIIAALLRCILCLSDPTSISLGTIWSIRETFVAILAVNIPVLKPLIFWVTTFLDDLLSSQRSKRDRSKVTPYNLGSGVSGLPLGPMDRRSERRSNVLKSRNGNGWTTVGGGGSEERIVDDNHLPVLVPHESHDKETSINSSEQDRKTADDGQIWVVNTFSISDNKDKSLKP